MKGIDDMYLFKQVVDFGSISAASRALRIPKSTVARRIADLEALLGSPLFHRTRQGMVLTNFGAKCEAQCRRLASEADGVFDLAARAREEASGFLHVVYPPFVGRMMVERLAVEFSRRTPEVQMHLEASTDLLDPRSISADLVLHFTSEPFPDVDVVARKLMDNPFILVGHPDLLRDRPPPADPSGLRRFPCLGFGPKSSTSAWRLQRGRDSVTHRFTPSFSARHLSALIAGAEGGLGIAALPQTHMAPRLTEGALVRVLPDWQPQPTTLYAIYPSGRALTPAARQLLNMMIDLFARYQREMERGWRRAGISY